MEVFSFDFVPYVKDLTGRLGYPVGIQHYEREVAALTYENHVEQFQLMEEVGFDGVCLNEHHGSPYSLDNSPNLFCAYIAAKTKHIKLAMTGNLLPLHGQPLRVAEELAMLDNLTRGRIIGGFVRGIPREYLPYCIPVKEGRPRFEEALDVIINAWTSDLFTHHGKYYNYQDVDMWPRPYQKPHPPVWVGAIGPDPTRNVARRPGVTLCVTFQPTSAIKKQLDIFREACAEAGRSITNKDVLLARHVFVAESQKEAEKLCKRHFEYYFHSLLGKINNGAIEQLLKQNPEISRDQVKTPYPFDTTSMEKMRDDGFLLVGTPDRVLSDLKSQYDELGGFGTFMAIVRMGAMPQELVLNNVRMIGKEVIPKLHAME